MSRFSTVILLMLLAGFPALAPLPAAASSDPWGTDNDTVNGPFAATRDAENCDRGKIKKPLMLADVVDLALCNNPQTRVLWASARAQAATVGVNMAAYLPTLTGQASASRDRTTVNNATVSSRSETVTLS